MTSNGTFKAEEAEGPPPEYNESQYISNTQSPPSYTQDQTPPPSYESLYGRVKAAKQKSTSKAGFFVSFLGILFGTLGCTVCLGLLLALPIAMIVIGSMYIHDCPAERYIPIYLIVAGSVGIIANLMGLGKKAKNRNEPEEEQQENVKGNPLDYIINCFLLAWFIAGNVWVYRTHGHFSTVPTHTDFCHPTVYWFAFWVITSTYILIGVICLFVCVIGCFAAFTSD
ncbi:transmembrane protein 272-like [Mytilus edulis]|uniref:transmembrane protein 272-like n=1 Tax=Mytilus edulis TaxID=6550 RepID=UPI0039EFF6B3